MHFKLQAPCTTHFMLLPQAVAVEVAAEAPPSPLQPGSISSQDSDSDVSCATALSSGSSSSDEEETAAPIVHAIRHIRRSSIIPSSTDQSVVLGTRLVLFRGLPKAKQRFYFQYMQQMAEYYAEVCAVPSGASLTDPHPRA